MSRTSAYSLNGSDTSAPLSVPMLSQLHGLGSEPVAGCIPRRPRLETSEFSTLDLQETLGVARRRNARSLSWTWRISREVKGRRGVGGVSEPPNRGFEPSTSRPTVKLG